ncbi:MAG: hypothetical protein M3N68_05055 [Actinomycetota bacterium]|nr:hypothetical protein [Actinomycetota bacterium]
MESRRWTNMGQPQTLQIAVFLLYINAAFSVFAMFRAGVFPLLFLVAAAGSVAGGFGTANEKKWGYLLAVAMAFFPFLLRLAYFGPDAVLSTDLLALMFEIALIALLLHPQSRDYQRIWFK